MNMIDVIVHNLQEEEIVDDLSRTPQIYATLYGRQRDHQATMVDIERKILNTYVSILIDPSACRSYVGPKILDICKLGKVMA